MSGLAFDTLKLAQRIEEAGFTQQQAAGIARAFSEAANDPNSGISSKGDIMKVTSEMVKITGEMEKIELRLTIKIGTMIFMLGGLLVAIKYLG